MAYHEEALTSLAQKVFDELESTRRIDLYSKSYPDLSKE